MCHGQSQEKVPEEEMLLEAARILANEKRMKNAYL
jgi:hypothetical protein